MNNANRKTVRLTANQNRRISAARDVSDAANAAGPLAGSKHYAASEAFLALAADASFADADRDAFAALAAEHADRA
jgi:hypothetical protein